ncbi:pre-mRNA-splicing factor CWC25 homolog [Ambystoma mexicanum]|uniref:pre-mRNA-splicing factor CWC25 homolog n=1 Tax=Ambystoma mexicanum TaxID=8296 RepID=UPI0037E71247
MGGGDLNLKKSWHPQTLRNVEKVWKAEQKHEAERKKIEELQRELREERAREEMQRYAENVGAVKKKDEKLDWMYHGPGGMVNREEYLLGRPVDKYVLDKIDDKEAGPSSETGLLPGSIFAPVGANSALDMASKIREDPLFMIRKREEEKKKEVLKNPVKMKKIREMLQSSLDKSERKKKKKKHKKHKQRSSSSEDERAHAKAQKKMESSSSAKIRISGYGLQLPASQRNSSRDVDVEANDHGKASHRRRHPSRSSSRSPSPRRHPGNSSLQGDPSGRRAKSRSRTPPRHKVHSSVSDRKEKGRPRSPSPKKQDSYQRRHNTGFTRKLTAEELERKRREMMDNAKWREEERANNVMKYKQEDEKEKEVDKKDTRDGKFIHRMKLESASTSSLEDRVKRNIHSIQRTPAALEKNFMKR